VTANGSGVARQIRPLPPAVHRVDIDWPEMRSLSVSASDTQLPAKTTAVIQQKAAGFFQ